MKQQIDIKNGLKSNLTIRILVLVALLIVFVSINANFFSAYNMSSILTDIGMLLFMSMGITFILLIGSIDLSVGAMISCMSVILALNLDNIGIWAYPACIGLCVVGGLCNGLLVTKLKIPSFVATLGTMSIYESLALVLSGSSPLQISAEAKGLVKWSQIEWGPIPLVFVLAIICMFILALVQYKMKFGKHIMAIGVNEMAARASGIRIDKTKLWVFVVAGLCYAFSTIVVSARLKSGIPTVGATYTLDSIAAAALGGTALAGGKGGVFYTLLGATICVVITNGMAVAGVEPYLQSIIYGIVIVAAIITTVDFKDKNLVVK